MRYKIIHSTSEDNPAFRDVVVEAENVPRRGDQVRVGDKVFLVVGIMHSVGAPMGFISHEGDPPPGFSGIPAATLKTSVFVQ